MVVVKGVLMRLMVGVVVEVVGGREMVHTTANCSEVRVNVMCTATWRKHQLYFHIN